MSRRPLHVTAWPTPTTGTVVAGPAGAGAACLAPFSSLYLDQRGFARACVANHDHVLGNLADHTIAELWHGPVAAELREALADHDYGLGCRLCDWQSSSDHGDALARIYDQFGPVDAAPAWPAQLELALGNDCNLQCVMCNGEQSSSIRSRREHLPRHPPVYGDRFFDELEEVLPHLRRLKFLGGEPFLVPEHHRVWDQLIAHGRPVPCHVTTNGTQWNDRVARVLEHLPVSFAVSMDGIRPGTVESIRVGTELRVLLRNVRRFRDYTAERGTELSLTFTLMRQNWEELSDFLRFADDLDVSVFVNSLYSPRRMSLYFLPEAELADVVRRFESIERGMAIPLGRNRSVWEDQLGRLRRRRYAVGRPGTRQADHAKDTVTLRSAHPAPVPEANGPTRADLQDWAHGGPVAELALDSDERVVRTGNGGGSFLGAAMDVVGLGVDELSILLESLYGRRCEDEERTEHGWGSDRVLTYEDHRSRVEVRITARHGAGADQECGMTASFAARPAVIA